MQDVRGYQGCYSEQALPCNMCVFSDCSEAGGCAAGWDGQDVRGYQGRYSKQAHPCHNCACFRALEAHRHQGVHKGIRGGTKASG